MLQMPEILRQRHLEPRLPVLWVNGMEGLNAPAILCEEPFHFPHADGMVGSMSDHRTFLHKQYLKRRRLQ